MADYQYDVFISYRRSKMIRPWVSNHFLDYFMEYLEYWLVTMNYRQPPKFFFDQDDIDPGAQWPQKLADALRTSKVLVSVCSPTYFNSQWCLSEWNSFIKREEFLKTTGLRIPVRYHDCEEFLRNVQWSDFSDYTTPADEWYKSAQATPLYAKINDLARVVAKTIVDAPPFGEWPSIDPPESTTPFIPQQRI